MRVRFAAILSTCVPASGLPLGENSQFQPQPQTGLRVSLMSEGNRRSVLGDDRHLQPIADLEAEGFPRGNLCYVLETKVIVRAIPSPGDPRPRVRIRSIQTVSETCVPHQ
jgi:hypothetical protein